VIARANTRVSVLRGTETNDYGDVVDGAAPVLAGIPASLLETSRRTYLPAEGAFRVVRSIVCRLPPRTQVLKGDRIRDERTNVVYVINDLNDNPGSPAHIPDVVVQLSRTT
jgi:hypothetical protein